MVKLYKSAAEIYMYIQRKINNGKITCYLLLMCGMRIHLVCQHRSLVPMQF